ncbi:MAG: TlpA family protein disulfide reductase [Lachnospiraceae bacterium]|nr:TlpA family protein disulfide reductase [Muribaculaceae bacterium]MCM1410039.1 TlpA family protein disulfide reductase [Lachnospiraceae bacterium]
MRKMYKICLLSAAVFFLFCGCGSSVDERKQESSSAQAAVEPLSSESEEPAATITFEAQDMEGNTVSSSVFSGSRLTMVNVWATYCDPCLREMPGLGELAGEYDAEDFQIIGIISDVQEGAD